MRLIKSIIYKHTHDCHFQGKEFIFIPSYSTGVMFVSHPVCQELGLELERINYEYMEVDDY